MESPSATHSLSVLSPSAPRQSSRAPQQPIPQFASTVVTSRWRRAAMNAWFHVVEFGHVVRLLRRPARIRQATAALAEDHHRYYGALARRKVARVAGRWYRGYHTPGWPSPAYQGHVANVVARLNAPPGDETRLDMALVAITKRCALACEHCFEWDALNQAERLSLADLHELVARFQSRHTSKIMFSGGEPMLRWKEIVVVLEHAKPGTDFWILTSGYHVTRENAHALRRAGLTGLSISLDHFDPEKHNVFRGSARAFDDAIAAARFAHEAGLVVNLSLCPTREFISPENLWRYAELAKRLGATFIQLVEPRAVGHYSGQSVELEAEHFTVLETFYEAINYDPEYVDWPIATYSGYHQRRVGCSGAGNRFVYVDTDGDLHACPFCQTKCGSALDDTVDDSIARLQSRGCHKFASSTI